MSNLQVTFACGRYDRISALADGRVRPDGTELDVVVLPPAELFRRQLETAEFDVSEFSMSHLAMLTARGDRRFTGIPAFTSRAFRHSAIYLSAPSNIKRPQDLAAKRVGVTDYTITAAVFVRALLEHEYGVPPNAIDWHWGGLDTPSDEPQRVPFHKPPGLRLTHIGNDAALGDLLVAGDLDGLVSAAAPRILAERPDRIRRLFPDYRAAEVDYYRRTGIQPIMHCVVIRTELVERHPWLPASLFRALSDAKAAAYAALESLSAYSATLVWLPAELETERQILGADHWPYGVAANRTTIEAMLGYVHEQGLTDRRVDIAELFAPDVIDT